MQSLETYNPNVPPSATTSTIPSYVSQYCSDDSEFSMACSCLGVTASTHTAAVPTLAVYHELPNCANPGICITDGFNDAVCGNGGGICVADASGTGWCVDSIQCGQDECASNEECMSGICLIDTCCSTGICLESSAMNLVEQWVGNGGPQKARRVVKRGDRHSGLGAMLGPPFRPLKRIEYGNERLDGA